MTDLTASDLGKLLDLSERSVRDYAKKGIIKKSSRRGFYSLESVPRYCRHLRETAAGRGGEDHVQTLTAERARLAREQADGQALKNAVARGAMLEAHAVEREWSDILRRLRSSLLAITSRIGMQLSAPQIEVVDRAIRDVLTELSQAEPDE